MRQLVVYILGLVVCTALAMTLIFSLMRKKHQTDPLDKLLNPEKSIESVSYEPELSSDTEDIPELPSKIVQFGNSGEVFFSYDMGVKANTADSDSTRFVQVKLQMIVKTNERSQFLVSEQPTEDEKLLKGFFLAAAWDQVVALLSQKTAFELQQEAIKLELKEDMKEKFNFLLDGPESIQAVIFDSFQLQ